MSDSESFVNLDCPLKIRMYEDNKYLWEKIHKLSVKLKETEIELENLKVTENSISDICDRLFEKSNKIYSLQNTLLFKNIQIYAFTGFYLFNLFWTFIF